MTETPTEPAPEAIHSGDARKWPWSTWSNRRWITIVASALAVIFAIVITVNVVQANAYAAAKAEAAAVAKAEAVAEAREEAEQERRKHDDALAKAKAAVTEGEAKYAESEPWGEAERRDKLRTKIDELEGLIDHAKDASTTNLRLATTAVSSAITAVGTEAEAQARVGAAAEKALDGQYLELAASLGKYQPTAERGREYCEYLRGTYAPDTVISRLWSGMTEHLQADEAAVRVYCPEFAAALDIVSSGFHDGKHIVGQDVPAGTYRTYSGVSNCYWERNDGSGDLIDNDFVTSAHNGLTVTVYNGEGFVSERCGLWVPAG